MSRIIQKISTLFNRVSRRNGSQTNAGQVEENEEKYQYNPLKVIEKIQANQQQIQEEMEKIQNKINYCEEAEQSAADQNKNNFIIVAEQIKIDQEQIRKEMEKMQIQINNYGEIYKLVHNDDGFKLKGLRKNIRLVICNCKELFKKQEFTVNSESIEVLEFKWWLRARTDKTGLLLGLFLCLERPKSFNGDHRIEIDYRLSILNAFHGKDLVKESIGRVYKNSDNNTGWGYAEMAKLEDLLNPQKDFLRPDGSIEIEADFTIKSSTLDHLL